MLSTPFEKLLQTTLYDCVTFWRIGWIDDGTCTMQAFGLRSSYWKRMETDNFHRLPVAQEGYI